MHKQIRAHHFTAHTMKIKTDRNIFGGVGGGDDDGNDNNDDDNDNDNTLIGLIDEVRLRKVFGIGRVSGKLN